VCEDVLTVWSFVRDAKNRYRIKRSDILDADDLGAKQNYTLVGSLTPAYLLMCIAFLISFVSPYYRIALADLESYIFQNLYKIFGLDQQRGYRIDRLHPVFKRGCIA